MQLRNLRQWSNVIGLFVTFLICGLWHGAGWNFIIWGGLHGVFMSVSLFFKKPREYVYNKLKINNTIGLTIFKRIVTFHLVAFSFLIFRMRDIASVKEILDRIITFFTSQLSLTGEVILEFVEKMPLIFALMLIGYVFHFIPDKMENFIKRIITNSPLLVKAVLLAVVIWVVVQFKSADLHPFIYFQF